jgi:hypothetical protein
VWFRRARLFIFAPDSQAKHACRQAAIPLNAMFKIPEPPHGRSSHYEDEQFVSIDTALLRHSSRLKERKRYKR